MANILHWVDGVLYEDNVCYISDFKTSIINCLTYLRSGMADGPEVITPQEAYSKLHSFEGYWVFGKTWLALVGVQEPWQFRERVLAEELFGPRDERPVDLEDFLSAMDDLGRREGCAVLDFGTRASASPLALARMFQSLGCSVSAVCLQRRIPYGVG